MGLLTRILQDAFVEHCPRGWVCHREAPLVNAQAASRLGFAPRADVMLEQPATARRVWVEFEISRADPVANHAKFGTSRFLEGQADDGDAFVSMASRHIAPGRLALAAGTAMLMRGIGISAFQVELLPGLDAKAIQRVNAGREMGPSASVVKAEIQRALQTSFGQTVEGGHRIHRADNTFSVAANVRQWNAEIAQPALAALWDVRRVSYFAYDRTSSLFAPSKFCAFIPTVATAAAAALPEVLDGRPPGMTMPVYTLLGENDPRFDGRIAWKHLHDVLGYRAVAYEEADSLLKACFAIWKARVSNAVRFGRQLVLLLPPTRT